MLRGRRPWWSLRRVHSARAARRISSQPGNSVCGPTKSLDNSLRLARHHHLVEVGQHPSVDLPAAIEQIPLPLQLGKRRTAVTGLGGGTVRSRSPARLGSPARRERKLAPPPRGGARRRAAWSWSSARVGGQRPQRRAGRTTGQARPTGASDDGPDSWATSPARACPRRRQTARWQVGAEDLHGAREARWLLAISRRRQAQAREPRPDPARRGTVQRRRRRPARAFGGGSCPLRGCRARTARRIAGDRSVPRGRADSRGDGPGATTKVSGGRGGRPSRFTCGRIVGTSAGKVGEPADAVSSQTEGGVRVRRAVARLL